MCVYLVGLLLMTYSASDIGVTLKCKLVVKRSLEIARTIRQQFVFVFIVNIYLSLAASPIPIKEDGAELYPFLSSPLPAAKLPPNPAVGIGERCELSL